MKTKICLIALLAFGFNGIAKADASIPAPIFYKLSNKLLNETQYLVDSNDGKSAKTRTTKAKMASTVLKCAPKKEQEIKKFGVLGIGNSPSLWKTDSDS